MTTQEFSNEMDSLLYSFSISPLYGETNAKEDLVLDEYEKSVYLTQAQEEIIKGLYTGGLTGESFEETEFLRRSLDNLVETIKIKEFDTDIDLAITENSTFCIVPDDVWFITFEQAKLSDSSEEFIAKVIPVRQDEWHRVKNNPFRMPNKNRAIRLDSGSNFVELISNYTIIEYTLKYLKKPSPIILVDLPNELSIDGVKKVTECKLNSALHRIILERAVQLAYKNYSQANK